MIAKVVFDLPLPEPFDYLIPEEMASSVVSGIRVKVPFGPRALVGFVVDVVAVPSVPQLRPIKSIVDEKLVFDSRDLEFAKRFCGYYACSLGEALAVMTRHRKHALVSGDKGDRHLFNRTNEPKRCLSPLSSASTTLYHCLDGQYRFIIDDLTKERNNFWIVVPDAFVGNSLGLSPQQRIRAGLRSSIFQAFVNCKLLIMIDEDNISYKQEQSPMYEARQALLMAQDIYGFDIAFIGASPSVELMSLVERKKVSYDLRKAQGLSKPVIIDLTNYRFLDKGMLSPPVCNALEANIKVKHTSLIVLNRKGSYSVTRCNECGHILKCQRCSSTMTYARSLKQYVCRHCTYSILEAGNCPQCQKNSWKSFGMGVEQLQKEIESRFPGSRIAFFERGTKDTPTRFDVLIATQAVLRFKGKLNFKTVILVDFDAELNRIDMRSSFKAWSLAVHVRPLGEKLLVQTRNREHHVLKALSADDAQLFYQEEMKLRKELGFAPFYHWIVLVVRGRVEKTVLNTIEGIYNDLIARKLKDITINKFEPDVPAKLRDQYRYRISLGCVSVEPAVVYLRQILSSM